MALQIVVWLEQLAAEQKQPMSFGHFSFHGCLLSTTLPPTRTLLRQPPPLSQAWARWPIRWRRPLHDLYQLDAFWAAFSLLLFYLCMCVCVWFFLLIFVRFVYMSLFYYYYQSNSNLICFSLVDWCRYDICVVVIKKTDLILHHCSYLSNTQTQSSFFIYSKLTPPHFLPIMFFMLKLQV